MRIALLETPGPAEGRPARDFYVRQLRDWKGSVELEAILPRGLAAYDSGVRMDARPRRRSSDALSIAAYLGESDRFDRAVAEFPLPTPSSTTRITARSSRLWRPAGSRRSRGV